MTDFAVPLVNIYITSEEDGNSALVLACNAQQRHWKQPLQFAAAAMQDWKEAERENTAEPIACIA